MAKIIKVIVGTASFVVEEEYADEATAQIGEAPIDRDTKVTETKVDVIRWKRKPKADQ